MIVCAKTIVVVATCRPVWEDLVLLFLTINFEKEKRYMPWSKGFWLEP